MISQSQMCVQAREAGLTDSGPRTTSTWQKKWLLNNFLSNLKKKKHNVM